jgi:hypothetical protein
MRDSNPILRRAALSALLVLCASAGVAAQEASTTYRGTARDPFARYKPPIRRKAEPKKAAAPVTPPTTEARIEQYRALRQAAMSARRAAPKPTTAILLSELQVTGIFRTPRGYAAMVEATPIKLSYVVYPGEPFYDGMLVAIEESRLVFRRQTRWTDGRTEVAVETKPLRQPNVKDAMTVPKGESAQAAGGGGTGGGAPAPPADVKNEAGALLELLKALAAGRTPEGGKP